MCKIMNGWHSVIKGPMDAGPSSILLLEKPPVVDISENPLGGYYVECICVKLWQSFYVVVVEGAGVCMQARWPNL